MIKIVGKVIYKNDLNSRTQINHNTIIQISRGNKYGQWNLIRCSNRRREEKRSSDLGIGLLKRGTHFISTSPLDVFHVDTLARQIYSAFVIIYYVQSLMHACRVISYIQCPYRLAIFIISDSLKYTFTMLYTIW